MKKRYEQPTIEIHNILVEQGFAISGTLEDPEDGGTDEW